MPHDHNPALYTLRTVRRLLGVPEEGRPGEGDELIRRVELDWWACGPGALFAPKEVGRPQVRAVRAALQKGASASLVTADRSQFPPGAPVLKVGKVTDALTRLGAFNRRRFLGCMVGVTGSVGKTSTKDVLHHLLSQAGASFKSDGNRNGMIGVAASLASVPPLAPFAVLEVATNSPGTIARICKHVRPEVGVVTKVGHSHGSRFDGQAGLIREKLSILDRLERSRIAVIGEAVAALDRAHENLLPRKPLGRLVTVGAGPECTVRIGDAEVSPTHVRSSVLIDGRTYPFVFPHPARVFVETCALALATAHALGLDLETLAPALATASAPPRRVSRSRVALDGRGKVIELVDDAFNAAPDSVRALLAMLRDRPGAQRKVLILGDMRELGPGERRLHEELAEDVEACGVGLLVTVGELARIVGERLKGSMDVVAFAGAAEAGPRVRPLLRDGDLVAVKGSASVKLLQVLHALRASPSVVTPAAADWSIEAEAVRPTPA